MSNITPLVLASILVLLSAMGCAQPAAGTKEKNHLITLDPGHFHAALVQKQMDERIDPVVNVYAAEGDDLQQHIARIDSFNSRKEDPTHWQLKVHASPDFFEKMLNERPGNVVV